jgi:hypothetical protein
MGAQRRSQLRSNLPQVGERHRGRFGRSCIARRLMSARTWLAPCWPQGRPSWCALTRATDPPSCLAGSSRGPQAEIKRRILVRQKNRLIGRGLTISYKGDVLSRLSELLPDFLSPLRSSGQSSWLQIQRSGFDSWRYHIFCRLCGIVVRVPGYRSRGPWFDSRRYQIFWEVVGMERGQFSLVSTNEELLGRNNSGSGLEIREYDRMDPLRWPRDTLYPQKLALTSLASCSRSVSIVPWRTKTTEFRVLVIILV